MKNQVLTAKHLIIGMLALFSFAAKAQTAGDTLAAIINVDSGVVNIDTSVAIHNSALSVDGGNTSTQTELRMQVIATNNELINGSKAGDIFISAQRNSNPPPGTGTPVGNQFGGQFGSDPCECIGRPGLYIDADFQQHFTVKNCLQEKQEVLTLGCGKQVAVHDDLWVDNNINAGNQLLVNGVAEFANDVIAYDLNSYPIFKINATDQTVYAREIKLQTTAFPDFVFDSTYCQPTTTELEAYIKANHHLPQMPTAAEAEANGVNVSEMQNKLLQKVEELTLIVIEQNKRIAELEKKK